MHPFFKPRPGGSAASAPPATPYQRAAQVWDDRMGLSLAHARNWRLMAFGCLLFATFLGSGWWFQAQKSVVKPYIVEVASWGQTQKITALDQTYRPKEAQIAYMLSDWIINVRSRPLDPVIIRQNLLKAYHYTTPRSANTLNQWAQTHDPFLKAGIEAKTVTILNVVARTETSFDIQWREESFEAGMSQGSQLWRALITIGFETPKNEAELLKNPLGLKIEDVSWSPDALS